MNVLHLDISCTDTSSYALFAYDQWEHKGAIKFELNFDVILRYQSI